ncbi:alcohol dehydrogenase catalytic domain-containing protein [Fluviispira multicolorata]|uniref:Alcohol dehydrogenase catalytic domain-containing protein n=1 Tax=Fluviispira multicolorata TaxID=2654512 RepID=A0A833N4S3_9BACT|nr:alcohol dehydrogenase catalytic domain-containing protein [Fluviispira multicolorata]KAB8031733.1 alcohol dehydrogenase catalytic domain-containing protein [Fluviispira multicolorata]
MNLTKAYAALDAKSKLQMHKIERREVGAKDILIEIEYCGVCHSDIHSARNEWGGTIYPIVPGHEIAGKVIKIGSQVTQFKIGDQVGVGCFIDSCRTCPACKEGVEQYCDAGFIGTYNGIDKQTNKQTFGGYS